MYNMNSLDVDGIDANYRIIAGNVNAVYTFTTSEMSTFHPYLIGGLGVYNFGLTGDDAEGVDSETKLGVNAGAGFNFSASESLNLFVEGRFHNIFSVGGDDDLDIDGTSINFIPITVGLRFGGN
jgi:opacity protein-like surface antigen